MKFTKNEGSAAEMLDDLAIVDAFLAISWFDVLEELPRLMVLEEAGQGGDALRDGTNTGVLPSLENIYQSNCN